MVCYRISPVWGREVELSLSVYVLEFLRLEVKIQDFPTLNLPGEMQKLPCLRTVQPTFSIMFADNLLRCIMVQIRRLFMMELGDIIMQVTSEKFSNLVKGFITYAYFVFY